jgi:hypothetical protein
MAGSNTPRVIDTGIRQNGATIITVASSGRDVVNRRGGCAQQAEGSGSDDPIRLRV